MVLMSAKFRAERQAMAYIVELLFKSAGQFMMSCIGEKK
jgi:hypothetical protein